VHGIIFVELKGFVEHALGVDAWQLALQRAELDPTTVYLPIREYPDSDIEAIVGACVEMARLPVETVLERFGQYIVPGLVKTYPALIDRKWRTLELLQNTDQILHKVVRARIKGARPPTLRCESVDAETLRVFYSSHRSLCALAKGIMLGVAKHYNERAVVDELHCRLRKPSLNACEFLVQVKRTSR
jgi:predicted hydrocarbon binding protein